MKKLILIISFFFSINLCAQNISVSKDTLEFFDFWVNNKSSDSINIYNDDNSVLSLDSIATHYYMFHLYISYNDSIVNEYLLFSQEMTPLLFEIPANDSAKLIFDLFVPIPKLSHSSDIWTDSIIIFNNSKNNFAQDIIILSDVTLGIDDNIIPISFKLFQNYPNPFNPITKIKYSIPSSEYVEIKIFDVLGNEMINLVNEYKSPGTYEIEFDANNLSSGIYFYRIISGKHLETKKMLLLR